MSKLPKWAHYGLLLLIIGGVLGALLVLVNSFTAPIISQNEIKEVQPLLEKVSSASTKFEEAIDLNTLPSEVDKVFYGFIGNEKNTLIYWVETPSYGTLTMKELVAIDLKTHKIIKVVITSTILTTHGKDNEFVHYNTFFNGSQSAAEFANKKITDYTKNDSEIISGATVSSSAVISGVIIATNHYVNIYMDGKLEAPLTATVLSSEQLLDDLSKFKYVLKIADKEVEVVVNKNYELVSISNDEYTDLALTEIKKRKVSTYIDEALFDADNDLWTVKVVSKCYYGNVTSTATLSSDGTIESFKTDLSNEIKQNNDGGYYSGYNANSFNSIFDAIKNKTEFSALSGATVTSNCIIDAKDALYRFIEGGLGND